MSFRFVACAALLLSTLTPAAALDCSNAITQAEMNQCTAQSLEEADQALNEAYGELVAGYAEQEDLRNALRDAQRAWIRFRDAECDFRTFSSRTGSIYPTVRAGCLEDLTKARTEQLRKAGECEEGDLSCNP
ncbi:lysozyme inhibitor LprI family protein [Nitratireductor basaltis]|uniref:Lysozyme inhibitor LprI-like N-terminal domain-containing protein n=1 Tax=Nitratireductor basaltis TaxID=472175 RepID=A0A084U6R7_9HYPH|nr:lysozyme inhibitor LprI family protein [Nitratireductor basaltis]KFB08653.1 hypothetical protein EL18_02906 [Nitratireductor basaltis]